MHSKSFEVGPDLSGICQTYVRISPEIGKCNVFKQNLLNHIFLWKTRKWTNPKAMQILNSIVLVFTPGSTASCCVILVNVFTWFRLLFLYAQSGRSPGGGHATNSRVLAWVIPWIEELGRLQSMESQRVEHDWATNTFTSLCFSSCT